jgi:hypothetical protein
MVSITKISEKIKILKDARVILQSEYEKTEFHKRKVANPQDIVPPKPEDEAIFKLLTAIHQIDIYIKKLQDEQYKLLKDGE